MNARVCVFILWRNYVSPCLLPLRLRLPQVIAQWWYCQHCLTRTLALPHWTTSRKRKISRIAQEEFRNWRTEVYTFSLRFFKSMTPDLCHPHRPPLREGALQRQRGWTMRPKWDLYNHPIVNSGRESPKHRNQVRVLKVNEQTYKFGLLFWYRFPTLLPRQEFELTLLGGQTWVHLHITVTPKEFSVLRTKVPDQARERWHHALGNPSRSSSCLFGRTPNPSSSLSLVRRLSNASDDKSTIFQTSI